MAPEEVQFAYVPCRDSDEARNIGRALIERRLVACVNLLPIESIYRWEDSLIEDSETVLLAKTTASNYERVREAIVELHSYELPCIAALSVQALNEEYRNWLIGEIDLSRGSGSTPAGQ